MHGPAETERDWFILLKSDAPGIIRSQGDWKRILADPDDDLLDGWDPSTIRRFSRSLKFNNFGLAGANYEILANQLTYHQFRTLWGRFGMSMGLFVSGIDMACNGTQCWRAKGSICTSNCCA